MFEEQISRRGGYKLTVMVRAGTENLGGTSSSGSKELMGFVMFKLMPEQRTLSIAFL